MIYSLFNKFQGAWLGSVIATARLRVNSPPSSQSNPASNSSPTLSNFLPNSWEHIATIGIQSLSQQGYLDLNHWQAQIAATNPELLKLVGTATASEAVWATLPISLFCHEHYATTKLLSALDFWLAPDESPHLGLAMGEAIALLLDQDFHEEFPQGFNQGFNHHSRPDNPANRPLPLAFQQLLSRTFSLSSNFWENLPCLEAALKAINSQIPASQVPFAIACYCLLSTPEDFTISIDRAAATPQPEIAIALTGFLSGAYNTLRGIPLSWQTQINLDVNSGIDYYQLVDRLFATWSGVYHHYQSQDDSQYSQDSLQDNYPKTPPETQQWQIAKSPAKPVIKISPQFPHKLERKNK